MGYYYTNVTLLIFVWLSFQSSLAVEACVNIQTVNASMYRVPRYLKISWAAQVSGCDVIDWDIHYESTSPVRTVWDKHETAGKNSTFVSVTPSFDYEIYIEAQTNTGQTARSSKVTYSAPKDKPSAAPSGIQALSIKHNSIVIAWQKVDLLHKNGDVRGYRIAYRDASTGAVKYFNVVGEDSLNTTLTGLQPKHTYQIMIQCINDVGGGPFSSPMLTITMSEPSTTTTTIAPFKTIINNGTFTKNLIGIAALPSNISNVTVSTKTESCVTFQSVNATMYRVPSYMKISWAAQVSRCNVINWNVHYDSTSPIRIFQNRTVTARNSTFVSVTPNFNYEIHIESQINSGQIIRSSKVSYSAPKDKPSAAPSRFHATSTKNDNIALVWQKVDILHKNGDVSGYRIAYRDTSTGTVNYTNVLGEDSLNTTLTGLQPNHTYQMMIQCINDVGGGPFSSPMLTITMSEPSTTTTTIAPFKTITNNGTFTKNLIGIAALTKTSNISNVTVSTETESCVTFQSVNATMYRVPRYVRVSWAAQVSGCNVISWNVHYDCTSPMRIFQNRTVTAGNSIFVTVTPNFNYEIHIEAHINSGQIIRSFKVSYSAPKDKPSAAPSRFHATSIKNDSITLVWKKVDILHKNGDVSGYRIAYRDVSTGAVKYFNVVGEESLNTTLTGLQSNHTYQIMIQCINDVSGGPFSSPMITINISEPATTTTTIVPFKTITNNGTFTKNLIGIAALTKTSNISNVTVSTETGTTGSCVTFQSVNANMYRVPRYMRVSWAAQVSGCKVINWKVHYDCTSPMRIFQNRTLTTGNSTFVPVTPSFNYVIHIEAHINSGKIIRSSKASYSAPKDKPSAAPPRFHAKSISNDSIALIWQKVDVLHKNGDVSGYRIAYRDASTVAVKYFNVVGEDCLNTTLTDLQPNHTYQIMIQCINNVGGGPFSSPMLTINMSEPPTITNTTTTTTITFATSPTSLVIDNNETLIKLSAVTKTSSISNVTVSIEAETAGEK